MHVPGIATSLTSGGGLVLNEGVMWAVTDDLDVNYSGSKLIAAGGVFLFNFCRRKTLLFSPEEQ
jgi:hypothetical protein